MWPTVVEANTEELTDMSACSLIDCCNHIQTACIRLATTNAEMKKKLEIVRSVVPDPVLIYARSVESEMRELETKKQALANALTDGYALMGKVNDWSGILALKNHQVYPLQEQIQSLFANTRACINRVQLQQLNEQIDILQAQVDAIEEESARTKRVIRDLRPSVQMQVLQLKEVRNSSSQQLNDLQVQRPTTLTSQSTETFTQSANTILANWNLAI